MTKHSLTVAVAAALLALAGAPALAQDKAPAAPKATAPAKAAPSAAVAAAPTGKELYPKAYYDLMLKDRVAQGQPDTPELRASLRDELNTRELLLREAKKKGLDKNPDVKTQMDLTSQTVLVRAFVADWVKANPISDAVLQKEYEAIKALTPEEFPSQLT
jgi:peptidyl-prolyl cis-trans isomerase C